MCPPVAAASPPPATVRLCRTVAGGISLFSHSLNISTLTARPISDQHDRSAYADEKEKQNKQRQQRQVGNAGKSEGDKPLRWLGCFVPYPWIVGMDTVSRGV